MATKKKASNAKARRVKDLSGKNLDVKKAGQVRGGMDAVKNELTIGDMTAVPAAPS